MFAFLDENGNAQGATGKQRFVPLVEFHLPTDAGGVRRWAVHDRGVVHGGQTYARYTKVLVGEPPTNTARLEDVEDWTLTLQDGDGEWEKLLAAGPLGPREGRLGSRCWVRMLRELNGELSSNSMVISTGWLRQITPEEAEQGRVLRLQFANEIWSEDKDATLSATWDAERDVDESAESAKYADEAQDVAWGTRLGVQNTRG